MRQEIKKKIRRQVKTRIWLVALFLFNTSSIIACTKSVQDKHPDTAQVKLPWYSPQGYQQQIIDIISITDMVTLKGWAARFLLSPGIDANGKLYGTEPSIHTLRTSDGVYVPTNILSAELLTLYAHFEKLALFDMEIGADKVISNWPRIRTVAVSVNMADENGTSVLDNVRYNGELDAFLFVPYVSKDLPFSMNAGVIGHEHFHSLFYQLVVQPSLKKYPQLNQSIPADTVRSVRSSYHKFLLRALNEGLADVWGWIYSGDSNFVQRSRPLMKERNISLKANELYPKNFLLLNSVGNEDSVLTYNMGTSYARKIYKAMQDFIVIKKISEAEGRKQLARALLRSIIKIQDEFIKLKDSEYLDPKRPLEIIQAEYPELKIMIEN